MLDAMTILPPDVEILSPVDDHIFKTLLTHPDMKPALMDIISASIDRSVIDVAVRNNELPVTDDNEKGERLDVNCAIQDGDQVDVEMHGSYLDEPGDGPPNFFNKYVYYLTDLHSSQKSKGVKYSDLVRTYQITFCNYTVFPKTANRYITRGSLRTPDGEEISDQINFIVIELSKLEDILKKHPSQLTPLEAWSVFFRCVSEAKHRDYVNQVIAAREEIAMAGAKLMEISKDEHERARYRSRRMFETDKTSNELTVIHKAMLQVARNMKSDGDSPDKIMKITGLTAADVEKA